MFALLPHNKHFKQTMVLKRLKLSIKQNQRKIRREKRLTVAPSRGSFQEQVHIYDSQQQTLLILDNCTDYLGAKRLCKRVGGYDLVEIPDEHRQRALEAKLKELNIEETVKLSKLSRQQESKNPATSALILYSIYLLYYFYM